MFLPGTPNPWGLRRAAHLVEVEVHDGRGALEAGTFVATDVRVLDGTPEFPSAVDGLLIALRHRFDAEVERRTSEMTALLEFAEAELEPDLQPIGASAEATGLMPLWDPSERVIEVTIYREVEHRAQGPTRQHTTVCPGCESGRPCMRCEAGTFRVTRAVRLVVAIAARYRVNGRAELLRETLYAPLRTVLPDSRSTHGTNAFTSPTPEAERTSKPAIP